MGAHARPLTHPVRGHPGKCLRTDLGRAVILSRAGEDGCGGGSFTLGACPDVEWQENVSPRGTARDC